MPVSDWECVSAEIRALDDPHASEAEQTFAAVAERLGIPRPVARFGRFEVRSRLGQGAMGIVYLAHDVDLDRPVALKVLRSSRNGKAARARFAREAQVLARLRHPNVVAVYERGTQGDNDFVAMEYVDGGTLREWLSEKPRPLPEILAKFVQAARGLAAAHAAEIVHRDFKPDNLLVGRDGRVQVADFGLAASHREVPVSSDTTRDDCTPSLTRTGVAVGTPAYMALEVLTGGPATSASDQFSFCVSLFEAVHGQRPFRDGSPKGVAAAIAQGHIRECRRGTRVPAWLRRVIRRGLRPSPADRWPDMLALARALECGPCKGRTAVVVGVAALGAVASAAIASTRDDPCASSTDAFETVWPASRAATVRYALAESDFAEADAIAANVTGTIDAYVEHLGKAAREACEASSMRGEQSPSTYDLRLRCLQRRRLELDELANVLEDDDATTIGTTPRNMAQLVPVEVCADVEALAGVRPVPDDPRIRRRLEDAERRIARLDALARSGRVAEAKALLAVVEQIDADLDYGPLSATVALTAAVLASLDHQPQVALAAYRDAFALAQQVGDTRLAAGASVLALSMAAGLMRDLDEAQRWRWLAEPLVERYDDDALVAAFWMGIGAVATLEGKNDEAIAAWRRAVDRYREVVGDDDPRLVDPMENIASALRRSGRADEALSILLDADRVTIAAYGAMTPIRGSILNKLGLTYTELGRLDDAEASFELSLRLHDLRGTRSPGGGHALNNLGIVEAQRGDHVAAIALFDRALARWRPAYGNDHPYVADALGQRGLSELALGRSPAGKASLAQSAAIFEARGQPLPAEFESALADPDPTEVVPPAEAAQDEPAVSGT